jgi:hypothetical protein
MVYFTTENPNLGKFWRFENVFLSVFLWTFGIFYRHWGYIFYDHLVHFVINWYIFPLLVLTMKNLATPERGSSICTFVLVAVKL